MTEEEWLASADPGSMLGFIEGKASDRKLRLFTLACCRRVWPDLDMEFDRKVVEAAERTVDGMGTPADAALITRSLGEFSNGLTPQKRFLACIFHGRRSRTPAQISWFVGRRAEERAAQVVLLRDVTGNPFQPSAPGTSWLTPTVTGLGAAAYEDRILPSGELDPARLAVLSDALEEAGCSNTEILGHLRSPGPHVRGCWAIDLLTGRC